MMTTLKRLAERAVEFSARRSVAILALVLVVAGACAALRCYAKPIWYDEICTLIVARQPGAQGVWKALENAADTNPPGHYMAARLGRRIIPDDAMGYRLPSMAGLLIAVAALYAFLARRVNGLAALVGAAFALCTPLAYYAAEARPYAFMLGCAACALVAWQRIGQGRLYPAAFALSLAAAVSLHYYAALVWPALILAEAAVWRSQRRFRFAAWAAMAVGAIPLLLSWKLLMGLRQAYGTHFWARASLEQVFTAHDGLFNLGVGTHWGLTVAIGLSAALAWWGYRAPGHSGAAVAADSAAVPVQERVLALGLLWIPAAAVAAAVATHGALTQRYMLGTVLGAALAVGFLAARAPGWVRGLLLGLFLFNYALSTGGDVKRLLKGAQNEPRVAAASEAAAVLEAGRAAGLPVVISSGLTYLPMTYYAPASLKDRLYLLTDAPAAVRYGGTDSIDLAVLILRRYYPMQVVDFAAFAPQHREFLLLAGDGGAFDWWPARLAQEGHTLTLTPAAGGAKMYHVKLRP